MKLCVVLGARASFCIGVSSFRRMDFCSLQRNVPSGGTIGLYSSSFFSLPLYLLATQNIFLLLPSASQFCTFVHVQTKFFKDEPKSYGGELLKKRKGRRGARPLDTKNSMHLVMRSRHAKGPWSFKRSENSRKISLILRKFAVKYGVRILSVANVGNHLHLHIQLTTRFGYKPFIRAITAAIAMAITEMSRWNKLKIKFWDLRPFTRVVIGRKAWMILTKYIRVNQLEGMGYSRETAKAVMAWPEMAKLSGLGANSS